jgi:hypothetical protein
MARENAVATIFAGRTDDELIEGEDLSLAKITEKWGCTKLQLRCWIDADPGRRSRVDVAREAAADFCDREAERILRDLKPDSTAAEIARARELAQHLRWRARVRNPSGYGDKVTVAHASAPEIERLTNAELVVIAGRCGIVIDGEAESIEDRIAARRPEGSRSHLNE